MSSYTYPNTHVLKNKFGIKDQEQLDHVEATYVAVRMEELSRMRIPRKFDATYLKSIHKHLFQDIYEWAGKTRDEPVKLSDNTIAREPQMRKSGGKSFLEGHKIEESLHALSNTLKETNYLKNLPRETFATHAADLIAELNHIHPFRDGNGRTQRIFICKIAEAAGHTLNFSVISKERMIQASIAANERKDNSMMRRLFDEISDPDRTAMLKQSIASLERLNFNWNEQYVATLNPGYPVNVVFAGATKTQFMCRTQNQILFGHIKDLPTPAPQIGQQFVVHPTRHVSNVPERLSIDPRNSATHKGRDR